MKLAFSLSVRSLSLTRPVRSGALGEVALAETAVCTAKRGRYLTHTYRHSHTHTREARILPTFLLCVNIQGNIIWEKYKKFFTEDFIENKEDKSLGHINGILNTEEISCKDFRLPEPHINEIYDVDEFNLESINYSEQKFNSMMNQN